MFEFSKIFIDSRAAQGQHAGNIIGCIFSAKCAFQVQALHQLYRVAFWLWPQVEIIPYILILNRLGATVR